MKLPTVSVRNGVNVVASQGVCETYQLHLNVQREYPEIFPQTFRRAMPIDCQETRRQQWNCVKTSMQEKGGQTTLCLKQRKTFAATQHRRRLHRPPSDVHAELKRATRKLTTCRCRIVGPRTVIPYCPKNCTNTNFDERILRDS